MKKLNLTLSFAALMSASVFANVETHNIAVSGSFSDVSCTVVIPTTFDMREMEVSAYEAAPFIANNAYKNLGHTIEASITCPAGTVYTLYVQDAEGQIATDNPSISLEVIHDGVNVLGIGQLGMNELSNLKVIKGTSDGTEVIHTLHLGVLIADVSTADFSTGFTATIPMEFAIE